MGDTTLHRGLGLRNHKALEFFSFFLGGGEGVVVKMMSLRTAWIVK